MNIFHKNEYLSFLLEIFSKKLV